MATFTVYETDGTSRGTIAPSEASWSHKQAEDGTGQVTVNGADITTSQLGETTVVRINDGTADRFAFIPLTKTRTQVDGEGTQSEVELQGPGVRWLLQVGQVLQEDTTDCALPADTRWFGWMSGDYDDAAWTAPVSHGSWLSHPFSTVRPENWPAPFAEYIWRTTSTDLDDEDVLFRQTFTVSEDQDVVLCIAADDEFECWLDGTKLRVGDYGTDSKYAWKGFDELPLRLCSGTHTFAVRGRNLDIPPPNPAWVMWAFAEAAGDGSPAAQNAIWALSNDAESGTFTLRPTHIAPGNEVTVDYNESPSDLETLIAGQVGAGNVSVSGQGTAAKNDAYDFYTDASGGTFTITVDGQTTSGIAYNASAATIATAVEGLSTVADVTVTGAGTSGDPWRMEFVGTDAETSFSVSFDGSSLTGGTLTSNQVSVGTVLDPWLVEFTGELANTGIGLYIDDANLVGGTLTETQQQKGDSAATVAVSNTSSVVHYNPAATEPGLTPGKILKLCMDEARARGTTVLDDVSEGFSATLDSGGNAWGFELNLPVPLPASIHRVAVLLEEQGIDVWMDPNLTLQCDDEQGTDDTASTTFTVGSDQITNVRASQEESTVRNVVRLRTEKGWVDVSDSTSVTARGRWESGLILEGFMTALQAEPHTNLLLNDLATPQRRTTFDLPSEGSKLPYVDFGLGDRVNGPVFGTSGWATTDVRLIGISGRLEEGSIVWTVETVD